MWHFGCRRKSSNSKTLSIYKVLSLTHFPLFSIFLAPFLKHKNLYCKEKPNINIFFFYDSEKLKKKLKCVFVYQAAT